MLVPAAEALAEESSGWGFVGSEVVLAGAVLFAVFALVVFAITMMSVLRAPDLSGTAKTVWIVGCMTAPVLGPTFWFAYGRAEMQRRS